MDSYIGTYQMDAQLCESIHTWAIENRRLLSHDRARQYAWAPMSAVNSEWTTQYLEALDGCLTEYKTQYPLCYKQLNGFSPTEPRLQLYEPDCAYSHAHCENDGAPHSIRRHLVYMTYLNTVDHGGGTEFTEFDITTEPCQGTTVIWPAGWQWYHRGIAAPQARKSIITGWWVFDEHSQMQPI